MSDKLKSAAEFLAREALMGWRLLPSFSTTPSVSFKTYFDKNGVKIVNEEDWTPYADTERGWWQARMVIEEIRERGFIFELSQLVAEHGVQFWKTGDKKQFQWGETFGAAITLAAATALGWKEE